MKSVKTQIQSALSFKTVFSIHRLIGPCWQKRSVHLQIAVTKTSLRIRAIIPETRSRATTIIQSPHTKTRFTKSLHNFAGKSEVSQSQHAKGTFFCAKAYHYGMHVIYGLSVICDFNCVLTPIIVFKLRILIKLKYWENNISVNDQVMIVIKYFADVHTIKVLKLGHQ